MVYFTYVTDTFRVAGRYPDQAAADAAAAADSSLTSHPGGTADINVARGLYFHADGSFKPSSRVPNAARIRANAVAWARGALDLMQPIWLMDERAQQRVVPATVDRDNPDRWWNTRGWIMSGVAIGDALLDAGRAADAKRVMAAYRQLVPQDAASIRTWYLAHAVATWSDYLATDNGFGIRAYLGFNLEDSSLPTFASDAASADSWNGGDGTVSVRFARTALPEDYSA